MPFCVHLLTASRRIPKFSYTFPCICFLYICEVEPIWRPNNEFSSAILLSHTYLDSSSCLQPFFPASIVLSHLHVVSLDVGPTFLCPYKDISCNIFPELMNVWVEYTVAVVSPFWSHIVFTSFLQLVVGVVRRLRRLLLLLLLLVLLCWRCTITAS